MRDYFQILGVPHDAGAAAIREAHRRFSRRCHPDIAGDAEQDHAPDDFARAARELDREASGDEIAIDFPSVAPLVDRMRDAFFADAGASTHWSAYIELTRGEAREGARVPIDVPLAEPCGDCGGRGEVDGAACADCAGRGTRRGAHRVRLIVPAGVAHGARLRYQLRLPASTPATLSVSVGIAGANGARV